MTLNAKEGRGKTAGWLVEAATTRCLSLFVVARRACVCMWELGGGGAFPKKIDFGPGMNWAKGRF